MALDTLDFAVLLALAVAVVAYFAKDQLLGTDNASEKGFLSNTGSGSSRNLVEALAKNSKNTIVFYGSQTGTAEDYASKLLKELSSRFGLKCMTADLADYDYDNLDTISNDVLVFFLLATYGEGEPTDNAVEFYEYLQNDADQLATLKFTVFGLGNSTYEFYNAIGKNVYEKLESLGSESFAPYGEGDDGKGTMDEDFLAWKEKVFDALKNDLNFEEHDLKYEPAITIIPNLELTSSDASVSLGEPSGKYLDPEYDDSRGPFDHTHPYIARVSSSSELFNAKDRSCVHAEFDISNTNLRYSTGDHLAIWPSNSDENIEVFAKAFNIDSKLNDVFEIKALDSTVAIPFHTPITYGAVVRHHLEISGAISRQFLSSISNFSPTPEIKSEVSRLANDKEAFAKEVTSKRLDVADLLLKLSDGEPWTDIPFEFVVETIPHLQPRYYSISSSSLKEKTTISVTAVVEAETLHSKKVGGVVTNLLKHLEIEQNKEATEPFLHYDLKGPRGKFSNFKLPVHVRRSTFKLPSNPSIPVILIGPGTGIAPMRGFVRERVALKQNDPNVTIGETFVFYGCRNRDEDFLYKDEWPQYAKVLGDSFKMELAFSREDPSKKVYVQDKLLANQDKLNQLLDNGAYIYVCGDASRMARDVQKTLASIVAKGRGISEEKAAELLRSFKVQNRYQEDVW